MRGWNIATTGCYLPQYIGYNIVNVWEYWKQVLFNSNQADEVEYSYVCTTHAPTLSVPSIRMCERNTPRTERNTHLFGRFSMRSLQRSPLQLLQQLRANRHNTTICVEKVKGRLHHAARYTGVNWYVAVPWLGSFWKVEHKGRSTSADGIAIHCYL